MSADREKNERRGKKRRKKRSQIQMAKKFARGRHHGSDVDAATYQYMVRVLELIRGDFPTEEERRIFVKNVYEETVGREVEYATNQVGSRVLDSLLRHASFEVIRRLVDAFSGSLRPLATDRFASHVLQKILLVCADRGNPTIENWDETADRSDLRGPYNDIAFKLCKYFLNNTEEFVFDTYANHLLRTVLECLGGLIDPSEEHRNGRKRLALRERRSVVEEYRELLVQSCDRLCEWPQLLEFGKDELTSGFLQSMLYSLKEVNAETAGRVIDKIIDRCFEPGIPDDGGRLSNIFDGESSVRLLEACLAVARPESFSEIYEKLLKGNLKELSLMQASNFTVQRLLDHCGRKEQFEEIFEEISPHLSEMINRRHTGLLSSLANACLRQRTKQGAFVNELLKSLHCETAENQSRIVLCVATVKTPEELERIKGESDSGFFIDLHGSLTVQAMLSFNKPIKIVNSLLSMTGEELSRLFGDPKGSRIADAFMESKYVGEKSREKLAKRLKGWLDRLAKSTHGSRSFERIWEWARKNQRLAIMEELAGAGESLRSTKSGSIVSNKLNVPLFARSRKDWTESQGKEEKTRALFANVIGNGRKDRTE